LSSDANVFVRTRSQGTATEHLRQFCAERLAEYKVPDFFTFLDEALPRNANGKILKQTLRASIAD
jgi:acyl-CoA synthetase (AMP-forming)/AMP-acid ligase II